MNRRNFVDENNSDYMRRLFLLISFVTCLASVAETKAPKGPYRWKLQEIEAPNHVIKSIAIDSLGLAWMGTYDGLFCYDGNEVYRYAPIDNKILAFNRVDHIFVLPDQNILCRQRKTFVIFDRKQRKFVEPYLDGAKMEQTLGNAAASDSLRKVTWQEVVAKVDIPATCNILTHEFDGNGNLWIGTDKGLWLASPMTDLFKFHDESGEVVSFFKDNDQRLWIIQADCSIPIYNKHRELLGYLSGSGDIVKQKVTFPYTIRSIKQDYNGNIWIAALRDGVLLLRPTGKGYSIKQYKTDDSDDSTPHLDRVMDLHVDCKNRIWIANLYGELALVQSTPDKEYHFVALDSCGVTNVPTQVRGFHELAQEIMYIYTENGSYTCSLNFDDYKNLKFYHQQHEPDRTESIPRDLILAATQNKRGTVLLACGRLYKGTDNEKFLAETFPFQLVHTPQVTNDFLALFADKNGYTWAADERSIICLNSKLEVQHVFPFIEKGYERHFTFHPFFQLNDTCLLKGCLEGWVSFNPRELVKTATDTHNLYFSEIQYLRQNRSDRIDLDDTVTLQPEQRECIVRFSVLEYDRPIPVCYAYRLEGETDWAYTNKGETAPLTDLTAGTYLLTVRSTDGTGAWMDNEKTLRIDILPYWYEKAWVRCLMILALALIIGAIYYLIHVHIQQRVMRLTLKKIQEMEEERNKQQKHIVPIAAPEKIDKDETFRKRLYDYLSENIANDKLKVEDLAVDMGMSRAVFTTKIKELFGCTVIDLIIATRITRAIQYMEQSPSLTVSEIAYNSGFSDPRYFSRCFKKHTGKSPSDYMKQLETKERE